ncbi:protein of unknown function [Taphrina deformans PYCC 5710]|uniref:Uncharacterized protein n=1 Tax=Taphrina deformans (strain PYCC 5710 / ATCC 11124 / CBS 356.35 / IMI 108563 / JCM 9778 / NBRC 8474) TaxID=1097556 RepID=R4XAT6_TAPDE|nr:protein of unknown function [Taphrina deformans PYCC 5710]|eukprot:CCG82933.1 protein of unknown function [Taphrina deformans PYCC 5710]
MGEIILPYKMAVIRQAEPDKSFGLQTVGVLYSPPGDSHTKPLTAVSTLVSFKTKHDRHYNLTFIDGPSVSAKGSGFFRVTPSYDYDPDKVTWNKNLVLREQEFGAIEIHPKNANETNKIPFTGFENEIHFVLTPDLYEPHGDFQDIVWTPTKHPASGLVLDTAWRV